MLGHRLAFVLGLQLVMMVGAPTPADATGFGPSNGGYYYADNSGHSFYYDPTYLSTTDRSYTDWARVNSLDTPTDMSTSVNSSYNSQVDVFVTDDYDSNNGNIAVVYCVYWVSSDRCDQFDLVYNEYHHYTYHGRHVACHEIGHTTGLGDVGATDGCMGATGDYFGSHDRSHINSRY